MRRKRRRNISGASKKGIWFRWSEKPTVRVGSGILNPCPTHLAMKAKHGAEKSRPTRRKARGLRRGKCRARERHSREPPPSATKPKPPNLRKVQHRRRPEAWLVENSYTFNQKCKVYVSISRVKCNKHGETYSGVKCTLCPTKKKMKMYLLVKWQQLHERSRQLGFPDSMAFDSTFYRYLRREFQEDGIVYERSILRGTFPFRWIDPIGLSGESLILPDRPERVDTKKTVSARPRRRRDDTTPSIKCPYCGNRVFQTRPVCQKRSCGRSCREFFVK